MGHEPIDTKAVCGVRVDGYLSSHLVDPDSIGRQSTHAYGHARWDVTMNECVAHVDEAVNVWHRVGRRNPVALTRAEALQQLRRRHLAEIRLCRGAVE